MTAGITTGHADGTLPTKPWKSLGAWDVRVDPSMHGCFMQAHYGTWGISVRFGMDRPGPAAGTGYMMLFSDSGWSSLVPGQTYPASVKFDNVQASGWATWTGIAHEMSSGRHALTFRFDNADVFAALAVGSAFHVSYQGRALIEGTLPGSAQALGEVGACQHAYNAGSVDPFVAAF
jgi:hypothetical protein